MVTIKCWVSICSNEAIDVINEMLRKQIKTSNSENSNTTLEGQG